MTAITGPAWQPGDSGPDAGPPTEEPVSSPGAAPLLAPASGPAAALRTEEPARSNGPGAIFTAERAWIPALAAVGTLAAILYVWNLTVSGYANTYYSAAALAASQSWSAWFFGSFDANNFITVDKPPLSTMVMGLSVRVFGLSSWSILLPEALMGVATVGALFMVVRKSFGAAAATIASLVMALTPAAVLIFRFNNPDALLTLLLVLAAWALLHAIEKGSLRWVALAGALVGLGFLTKYLQAYLVLPAFALVFAFCAGTTLRRRVAGLLGAAVTVIVTSGWWVAIVQLLPADVRPFIGGSTNGQPWDLIVGYDGLGRIFGNTGPGGGLGGGFTGSPDLLRLFNDQMFGEIAWFVPLTAVCLVVGLYRRRWSPRTDLALNGYLMWGGWFLVSAVVFSYMSGIIHSYYTVALAPAIGALVGAGLVDLWSSRARIWLGGLAVGLACLGTAWFGSTLLDRTAGFYPGLGVAAIVLAGAALVGLTVVSLPRLAGSEAARRLGVGAAGLGLCAALMAPAAYAVDTIGNAYGGGDPHPGPGAPSGFGGFGGGFAGGAGFGGNFGGGNIGGPGGGLPGDGGGIGGNSSDTTLLDYLVSNRGTATWIVAVSGSQEAGSIEIATGLPVMAMGGFTGSDPTPTLDQLKGYIASGKLRFVIASGVSGGGFGGPGGFGAGDSGSISTWVTSTCKAVNSIGTTSLYDCAGAA